jgi:hypothetical protein
LEKLRVLEYTSRKRNISEVIFKNFFLVAIAATILSYCLQQSSQRYEKDAIFSCIGGMKATFIHTEFLHSHVIK